MSPDLLGIGRPRPAQLQAALRLWGASACRRQVLLEQQQEALREILSFAGEHVPYYRELFEKAGMDVRSIQGREDLSRIPISSKLDLKEVPRDELMPPGLDDASLIPDRSSGSRGIKLFVWREQFEQHLLQLFRIRAWREVGVRSTDRLARVSGTWAQWKREPTAASKMRQALRIFYMTKVESTQEPTAVLSDLVAARPDVVTGYPSVLHEVSRIAASSDQMALRPRIVLCGGETLIPPMREDISRALGVPVLNFYGAMEFNLLAWECPETGLFHVCDDALVLEVLRDDAPVAEGELGEVVVTGLYSYAFPLIRYRLGDLAVRGPESCPCGAPFSTLQSVRGRTVEYYWRADGSAIHHWELSVALNQQIKGAIARYQIVQEEDGRIVYRLMLSRPLEAAEEEAVRREATEKLGTDTAFEIRIEEEIACAPSGKMLQSVNRYRPMFEEHRWDPGAFDWTWGAS